jgi:hypothetical protein
VLCDTCSHPQEVAVQAQTIPNLDGLDRLAFREGVDIRPTLMRVLTDLYVQKPSHSVDEERRYTELVLRLIDTVDISTRAIVAKKLATYRAAPAPIVRRLARDALEVAEPVLKYSQQLTGQELMAVMQDFGPRYAEVIASRRPPEPVLAGVSAPASVDTSRKDAASTGEGSLRPSAAPVPMQIAAPVPIRIAREDAVSQERDLATPVAAPAPLPTDRRDTAPAVREPAPSATPAAQDIRLGELFFAATSAERRAMLASLDGEIAAPAQPQPDRAHEVCARLETAALERRPEDFAEQIELALGLSPADAWRIVADEDGEPVLVAAKALAMPPPVLLRILLFLNPLIGQSVERVFYLAQLYDRLAPAAALRIVATLRDTAPATRRAAHRPMLWDDDADRGRRAGLESARRPAGQSVGGRRDAAATARPPAEWTPASRPNAR